jgi:phage gp29-like protein
MSDTTLPTRLIGPDIATRALALDFSVIGSLLPNPDPILKEQGKDISTYRAIARDPHVGACIRRRKAALRAMEWAVQRGKAAARVHKAVDEVFSALPLGRIISQAQEAGLYGYAPMEVSWARGPGGLTVPVDVQAKPPEWFVFDTDNQLRMRTRSQPFEGELLPARKFLLPRQDPTYQNPYGLADLALCFWPTTFKRGGLRFWLTFAEKFGSAFAVGKLPRGASDKERGEVLDALTQLVQDGVAVLPDDGSAELVEMAGKAASADLYERLVMYCRGEISIVLTGTNQTVEASANKASAHAGQDVAADLRDGDADMVCEAVNQLIGWTCEVNWPGAEPPVFEMWDQEARDLTQASRDKSNYDAGARFTNAYWVREYGYQEGDLKPEGTAPTDPAANPLALQPGAAPADVAAAAFAEAADPGDPTAADAQRLEAAGVPAWQTMVDQVRAIVDRAADFGELQGALAAAYGSLDSADLVRVMEAAFALAELKGLAAVREETGRA